MYYAEISKLSFLFNAIRIVFFFVLPAELQKTKYFDFWKIFQVQIFFNT